MNRMVITLLTAFVLSLSLFDQAQAVTPEQPHNFTCAECHTPHKELGSTGYDNICLTCHRGGDPRAGAKSFAPGDAADPFGKYTSGINNSFQISHRWDGADTNARAGAKPPVQPQMTSVSNRTGNALACVRCHNPHSQENKPFLRMDNSSDQMCLDCHRDRNQTDHKKGTHPVGVAYYQQYTTHFNANPANPSSAMKLIGGKVSCSTCHGVHATDSNSATFDSFTTLSELQPSDGYLLRTDRKSATPDGINICTNCHAGKVAHNGGGQNVQCADCHGAHVDTGDGSLPNVWLVKRDMGDGRKPVQFTSTTDKNYWAGAGNTGGVCQSCHDVPTTAGFQFHLTESNATCNNCHVHGNSKGSFSAAGSCNACHGYPPASNVAGPGGYASGYNAVAYFVDESKSGHASHASFPYQQSCENCHKGNSHSNGTFQDVFIDKTGITASTGGLTPVYDTAAQTCSAVYCHSNANPRGGSNIPITTPSWKDGKGTIIGAVDECNMCHSAAGKTAPTWSASHSKHINGYAANGNITCNTCHAGTASDNSAIFNNMTARSLHTNGVKDIAFNGFAQGGSWDQTAATCSNLYCHSNVQGTGGLGSPTSFTPGLTWNTSAMNCNSCHASMAKMDNISSATGSHKRHAQNSGFNCSMCHGVGYSLAGSIRTVAVATHVDRSITMAFTGAAVINGATPSYSEGNKAPGQGYNRCTNVYCHSNVQGKDGVGAPSKFMDPKWGSASLACGSCHANMATAAATGSHVGHVMAAQYGCQTCHDGAGKDTAKHASGFIDLAFSGNATGTNYTQGTTVVPGNGYGNCTTSCHGQTAPAWGAVYTAPGNTFPYSLNQCDKCHATAVTSAAPFYSTAPGKVVDTTNAKVGAHTAHITSKNTVAVALSCADCHGAVTSVSTVNHMNGSTTFSFGALATSGGLTPEYKSGQCFNTYCHGTTLSGGSNKSPGWTQALNGGCDTCHGFPPINVKNGGLHPNSTACNTCHSNVNSTNNGFTTAGLAQHINGTVEGSCDTCHGYPPAPRKPAIAFGTLNQWPSARFEDYSGGGGAHLVAAHVPQNATAADGWANCTLCHNGGNAGASLNHKMTLPLQNSIANVTVSVDPRFRFADSMTIYSSAKLVNPPLRNVTGNCSNINCHMSASPRWSIER